MNIAFYDLVDGLFHEHQVSRKVSADDVRQSVVMLKLDAQQTGESFEDIFLVAWDGKASGFFSIFVMHDADQSKLNDVLLDSIKKKALKLSAK